MSQTERRTLQFESIAEALTDADALAGAEANGTLLCLGNWTLGQSLNHLAAWIDFAYDGFPVRVPLILQWLARPMRARMLRGPLKAGIRLPRTPGGTLATEVVPTLKALAHYRDSFSHLARERPSHPHPIFGPMSQEEWIALHLRHAELHLSFLKGA